jgi:hypothetical protein
VALFITLLDDLWEHDTLRYQWVRYLTIDPIPDDLWDTLRRDLIAGTISRDTLVNVHGEGVFPTEARIVPAWLRDNDGDALLPDCSCDECFNGKYISELYDQELDVPVLKKLGVRDLEPNEFVHNLQVDLKSDIPRMWSKDVTDDWHTNISQVLLTILETNKSSRDLIDQIKHLPLIPIIGKGPSHSKGVSIYMPTCGGIDIPQGLLSGLVQPAALRNDTRAKLFRTLGVTECDPEQVIGLISAASRKSGDRTINLEQSVQQVNFLYWHHDKIPLRSQAIRVFDIDSEMFDPNPSSNVWTYWATKASKYDLYQIFSSEKRSVELQGHVRFLNPAYWEALRGETKRHDKDPMRWFTHYFRLRSATRLGARSKPKMLSYEIKWLMEYNSGLLLGTIWRDMSTFLKHSALHAPLSKCLVPIMDSQLKIPLLESYLPIPNIVEIVSGLGLERDFGFVLEPSGQSDLSKWKQFHLLGIEMEEDLNFWIRVLKKASAKSSISVANMGEIYWNLQRMCQNEDISRIQQVALFNAAQQLNVTPTNGIPGIYFLQRGAVTSTSLG